MLILPGIKRAGGLYDELGLLDRKSAIEYAVRRGYIPSILNVSGEAYDGSPQVIRAVADIESNPTIRALYGFSGGGYNVRHILRHLSVDARARLKLVVVLGAPQNPASAYRGAWELVYRTDPPLGHMDGPKALLQEIAPIKKVATPGL